MVEVLTIGEPLALFASNDLNKSIANSSSFTKYLAGAEVNVAIGVHRLGHSVEYLSQVGKDPMGDFILDELSKNHIYTKNIQRNEQYNTGIEFKELTDQGDPKTFYIRKNSAASHIKENIVDKVDISNLKIAHLTGIFPSLSSDTYQTTLRLIKKLSDNNITISFDPNLRPALWPDQEKMCKTINYLAKFANIFLPGLKEAQLLTNLKNPDEIAEYYFDNNYPLRILIIKGGAKGTYIFTRNKPSIFIPSFKVKKIVDTVGAGDGFALGLITALLEHKPLTQAVTRANAIGALAIQVKGDNTGYPTPDELKQFLEEN